MFKSSNESKRSKIVSCGKNDHKNTQVNNSNKHVHQTCPVSLMVTLHFYDSVFTTVPIGKKWKQKYCHQKQQKRSKVHTYTHVQTAFNYYTTILLHHPIIASPHYCITLLLHHSLLLQYPFITSSYYFITILLHQPIASFH